MSGGLRLGRELAAVCCHFNPCHYASRLRNYQQFRRALEPSGIPLLTVELAFADEPFELAPDRGVLQIRGGDVLWQKERLLQIGAERLVDRGFRAVVFVDADVIFERSDWPDVVRRALDRSSVVQCFAENRVEYSDERLVEISGVKNYLENGTMAGRVGYAWAMRAEVLRAAGLYQHGVVGGGDSLLFLAALGLANVDGAATESLKPHDFIHRAGSAMLSHYRAWADRFFAASAGEIGYADLKLASLEHGARRDRKYRARQSLLVGFDPRCDVAQDQAGALVWTASGERFREPVAAYFRSRDEDGTRRYDPAA
jgi:hypothetical protein